MTKIKNTKKGMAKKTLSMSLVVAMLATSNVPVWAAEFSDGSDSAVATEAPAEDAFSAEADAAPVVEDNTEEVSATQDSATNYGYTSNITLKEDGNGWAGNIVLKDDVVVKDGNGKDVDAENYTWTVRKDGYEVQSGWTNKPGAGLKAGSANWSIPLSHDDYNHVYDVYIEITMANGQKVGLTSNKITVSPVDIDKIAKDNNNFLDFSNYAPGGADAAQTQYTGKEIKLAPNTSIYPTIMTIGGNALTKDDFVYTYSGDLVNYTDEDITVTGKVKLPGTNQEDPAYVGGVTGTYKIAKRAISSADINNKLTVELKNPDISYEYTSEKKVFTADDVKVEAKSTLGLDDSVKDFTYAVKKVEATSTKGNDYGNQTVTITLDTSKMPNFTWEDASNDEKTLVTSNHVKIKTRDLSKVTATVNRSYSVDELRKGVLDQLTAADLTFKDANGNEIKLSGDNDINISVDDAIIKKETSGAGSYAKAIKINAGNVNFTTNTNSPKTCENSTTADLTIIEKGLSNGKFVGATEADADYATANEEFAGEGVAVTKDTKRLGNFVINTTNTSTPGYYLTEGKDYIIEYANNTSASTSTKKAQMIVKGIGDYAGSQAVFEFTINPAPIKEAKTDKEELVYNPEYNSVADYLKDLNLTVNANNLHTTDITTDVFTLKDTDYTITNLEDLQKEDNKLDNNGVIEFTISVKANKDGNYYNVNGDSVNTKEITICKKSLSSKDVTVTVNPDSYVYTGTQIIPKEVIVKDGDTVLEEGTDYTLVTNIQSNDAVDAGTAKITVEAVNGGKYKAGSTATGTFTITPAKIDDVKVSYADATYNGSKHNDTSKVTLKLGDIDVTKDFDISFPSSKNANINAGKEAGTVILTAKKAKAKNYSAKTKESTFEIKQAELTGTLKAYDEAGREFTSVKSFDYDGTAHTFASVKFVPDASCITGNMKVTENDYEIVYVDNVYGKAWSTVGQLGHAFVVAKGNYKGVLAKSGHNELESNGTFVDANDNKLTSIAASNHFIINQAVIEPKDIIVANGTYAGGYTVKPNVTVKVNGKTLAEGKDYELDVTSNKNVVDVTTSKTLKVVVKPINGYKMASGKNTLDYTFNWGIDKFNLANATLMVSGTDADPVVKVMNGSVLVDPAEYDLTVADGKVTVTAKKASKNYTGTKTADIKHELEKPATPMISSVNVVGNKATVILSDEVEGATGYDYVISTDRDCITNKDYAAVNKNQVKTTTDFTYVQQDTYYAYCHAWKRGADGKKVFSDWSNAYPFVVSAITPSQPVITSVKAKGNTVTVTYTKATTADGYDVVLGSAAKKVNGEYRPVEYGKLVKKNIKGNVVTATFKNVKKGTYYAGLHAFKRTSEDGKKVFSQWSNVKKVTVK